jgi:hypothetical protein
LYSKRLTVVSGDIFGCHNWDDNDAEDMCALKKSCNAQDSPQQQRTVKHKMFMVLEWRKADLTEEKNYHYEYLGRFDFQIEVKL